MDNLIHGFTLISKTALDEMQAEGIFARHEKTGLEVYHIHNDDTENLFAFAFMTPPENNSGVAHILEHSVLCGSKNYPLQDPFLVLSKQSVKTFLNAMTFPDKTVYPASSIIEADYFNLMSVYGDAVFFPLLRQETFRQEGYRLEHNEHGHPSFSGVVLNEMRGAYTDFDSAVDRLSRFSLFQNSVYAHDSGGFPPDIVDLTYEDFCAFHKKYYHPVNCKVFLYGNIETEKQLAFLQERFLQFFEPAEKPSPIPPVPLYSEPRFFSVDAPAGEGKKLNKISLTMNWLLPENSDMDHLMDLIFLEEVLLGHDGAPLQKRLLECGFAEDVYPYNGGQSELKNSCFTVGLIDLEPKSEKIFEDFILSSLEAIIQTGIEERAIDTALNTIDFSNREIVRAGGPFSLVLMRRALRGWLHGGTPDTTLRYLPAFERLKQRIGERPQYTENLIRQLLLDNKHRTTVAVQPNPHFCEQLDELLAEKARKAERLLTPEAQQQLSSAQEQQSMPDTPDQEQQLIPHISKEQLPPIEAPIPEYLEYMGKVPVIFHEQPTNGITYLDLAIPVDGLSAEEYTYLSLYTAALSSMGTDSESWDAVAADFAYLTGGFSAVTLAAGYHHTLESVTFFANDLPAADVINRDWILIRAKMLPVAIEAAINRIFSYIHTASFKDEQRLKDIFIQLKNDSDSFPAYAGHSLTALYAASAHSGAKQAESNWFGIPQLRFLREWYRIIESDSNAIGTLIRRLTDIHQKLLHAGMIVKVCTSLPDVKYVKKALLPHVKDFSYPHRNTGGFRSTVFEKPASLSFFPSAVQVGFAGLVLPVPFREQEYGLSIVYAQWIETGLLWKTIRERGGAYSVDAHPDPAVSAFTVTTYRDPTPLDSLNSIRTIIEKSYAEPLTKAELDALITGTYSIALHPRTPAQRSAAAFSRILNGITYEMRLTTIESIVSCTQASLRRFAEQLIAAIPQSTGAVIASESVLAKWSVGRSELPTPVILPTI